MKMRRVKTLRGQYNIVFSVGFSPNEEYLGSGSFDKTIEYGLYGVKNELKHLEDRLIVLAVLCFTKWRIFGI